MKDKLTTKEKIKRVASSVKKIDKLRSDMFVKLIPYLYLERCAKIIKGSPLTWIVITEDKKYLMGVEKVELDYADDPGRHVKFYDSEGTELVPVPRDIIALIHSGSEESETTQLESTEMDKY